MSEVPSTRRRWMQYGLGTIFLVVTAVAIGISVWLDTMAKDDSGSDYEQLISKCLVELRCEESFAEDMYRQLQRLRFDQSQAVRISVWSIAQIDPR